jgi:hypothetical protein
MPPIADVAAILQSGDFNQFVGLVEDEYLEVKSTTYDLANSAERRYELAKDVAAMATSLGGYLIIGLSTTLIVARDEDEIDALTLIPHADFNEAQYRGIIATHTYPPIEGLTIDWMSSGGGPNGLGVILIPPQNADRKPFVIAKIVENGDYLKEIVVGYAQRIQDANQPLTPARLQEMLRKGSDSTSQRLTRIEELLDTMRGNAPQDAAAAPGAAAGAIVVPAHPEIDRAVSLQTRMDTMGIGIDPHTPYFVLGAAVLPPGNRLRSFHRQDGADTVRHAVQEAGRLRHAGFDLTIGAPAQPGPENSLEALQGERKHLRLYHDGTLVFRVAADDTFMGRAQQHHHFLDRPRLVPIVVVEVHASFVTFMRWVINRLHTPPDQVLFRMNLRNPINERGNRVFLTQQPARGAFPEDYPNFPLEADPADAQLIVPAIDVIDHPLRVAYQLVELFFDMFEVDHGLIPFVHEVLGQREIDVEALRRA